MPLSQDEKDTLKAELALLAELDEPEAMVAQLRRTAGRQAAIETSPDDRQRWRNVAQALTTAETALEALQAPKQAQEASP